MLPKDATPESGLESSSIIWKRKLIGSSTIYDDVAAVEWRHRQLVDISAETLALTLSIITSTITDSEMASVVLRSVVGTGFQLRICSTCSVNHAMASTG